MLGFSMGYIAKIIVWHYTLDLSPLIDCFDGLVVSWSIGTRPDVELVNTMLDAAIESVVNSNERPVIHSDHGTRYRWLGWLSRVRDVKLIRPMSRKGCSPDNVACEGFFGRLKTGLFYSRDWQATTVEQFIQYSFVLPTSVPHLVPHLKFSTLDRNLMRSYDK